MRTKQNSENRTVWSTLDNYSHQKTNSKRAYKKHIKWQKRKGKRKVQGVPQSQTAALPRHQEEEETDISKQTQIEQTYEKY